MAPLLLLLATFAVYAPALRNGFVWDDQALVLRDPLIRSWRLIGEGFQHFLFTDAAASDFYRPLQRLSYTLDYAGFFVGPVGYHLVSILWHAAAGLALYFFAGEFLRSSPVDSPLRHAVPFFAALLWLIHPMQSAAVIYVAGRADPMAAAFGFGGLFLGLRMLRSDRRRQMWIFGIGTGFCLLASALSKEIGLIFLLVWPILLLAQKTRRATLGAIGIVAAVLVAYLSLRLTAEHIPPPTPPRMPLIERPIIAARAVAEYAGLLIFPWRLHMERDVETRPSGFATASLNAASWRELQTLLGFVVIAAVIFALWRSRKRPAIFLPLFLTIVCYLPVSGLVTLNATVAEHWLYLPSAFLFLAAAAALISSRFSGWRSWISKITVLCLTTWLLFLGGRTFVRTFDWKNQRTFLTRTIADGGDSARMLINLGGFELGAGHVAAARQALERALAKEPGNPLAQLNFAAVEIRERKFADARARLKKIVESPEMRARAEESLAVLENRETGQVNLMRLRLAARLGPPNWSIEQRYIKALADLGYPDRAITELKTCLVLAPYRSESWLMMQRLLLKIGRPNEAAIAWREAEDADVHLRDRLTSR
ncbi:MAG TPA: tetratricopeptide repeat protein [Chthoniobacterales bacterium]